MVGSMRCCDLIDIRVNAQGNALGFRGKSINLAAVQFSQ